jgi:hypothetical protein
MSDVSRSEFEALKDRVAELEEQIESGGAATTTAHGLDHRDERVLQHMRENGRASGYRLVKLYTSLTDIRDEGKAKRRAKTLEQHNAYQNL